MTEESIHTKIRNLLIKYEEDTGIRVRTIQMNWLQNTAFSKNNSDFNIIPMEIEIISEASN